MKIGEAILERDYLNNHLDALESRLIVDMSQGHTLPHILNEIAQAAERMLSLQDAIDWTVQRLTVNGKPLGIYINRRDHLERMGKLLENVNSSDLRDKVDELIDAEKVTEILIQTVYWAHDLQIPEVEVPESEEPEEEK